MHAGVRWSLVCVAVVGAASLSAQPLDRLTGKVFDATGAAVPDADVRVEAMFGFAGGDFLGQRTFAARTNAKGEWALLAFKAGIWVFDAEAPRPAARQHRPAVQSRCARRFRNRSAHTGLASRSALVACARGRHRQNPR